MINTPKKDDSTSYQINWTESLDKLYKEDYETENLDKNKDYFDVKFDNIIPNNLKEYDMKQIKFINAINVLKSLPNNNNDYQKVEKILQIINQGLNPWSDNLSDNTDTQEFNHPFFDQLDSENSFFIKDSQNLPNQHFVDIESLKQLLPKIPEDIKKTHSLMLEKISCKLQQREIIQSNFQEIKTLIKDCKFAINRVESENGLKICKYRWEIYINTKKISQEQKDILYEFICKFADLKLIDLKKDLSEHLQKDLSEHHQEDLSEQPQDRNTDINYYDLYNTDINYSSSGSEYKSEYKIESDLNC